LLLVAAVELLGSVVEAPMVEEVSAPDPLADGDVAFGEVVV
jgi:hypothetical protein